MGIVAGDTQVAPTSGYGNLSLMNVGAATLPPVKGSLVQRELSYCRF